MIWRSCGPNAMEGRHPAMNVCNCRESRSARRRQFLRSCRHANFSLVVFKSFRQPGRRRTSTKMSTPMNSRISSTNWVKGMRPKLAVTVVKRSDNTAGFKVLPFRWVVERTFGWLMQQRRLARDYQTTESSAEACIYIAMIRIQLRRLA